VREGEIKKNPKTNEKKNIKFRSRRRRNDNGKKTTKQKEKKEKKTNKSNITTCQSVIGIRGFFPPQFLDRKYLANFPPQKKKTSKIY
jgi:hypothetical protein